MRSMRRAVSFTPPWHPGTERRSIRAPSPNSVLEPLQVEALAIAAPGARKILLRLTRLGAHSLALEARLQPIERPGVVRRTRQAFPERIACALRIALEKQHGAERLAHRVIPVRRLHVGQCVLDCHGRLEAAD